MVCYERACYHSDDLVELQCYYVTTWLLCAMDIARKDINRTRSVNETNL
jgi:hypothetical protein